MFALWPFFMLIYRNRSPILLYFIMKNQINQYTKYTNMYANFIILLCSLTVDFASV